MDWEEVIIKLKLLMKKLTMITYKIYCDTSQLLPITTKFNWVMRYAYNRWQDDTTLTLSEVEKIIKQDMKNIEELDASLIKMAVNQAKSHRKTPYVIFGSKDEFNKRKYHKEDSKLIWTNSRNYGMLLRGSKTDSNGNRKAKLDIENEQIIIKPARGKKIILKFKLSKKYKNNLLILQNKCENVEAYFNIQINNGYVCISFDENVLQKTKQKQIKNRILSIDSNPNYLGIVIADNTHVIYKEIIDIVDLNNCKNNNKKKHEKYQTTKHIMTLALHYGCEAIAIEKLNVKNKNHKKGKHFNRLVNNTWHRNLFARSIHKLCIIHQTTCIEVDAAYSSFVGCMMHPEEFDSIAAAIEINNRARQVLNNKKYNLLPNIFDITLLPTHWKEMAMIPNDIKNWKELYDWCKKTKFSYRILFNRSYIGRSINSLRLKSHNSLIGICHFSKLYCLS